MTWDVGPFLGKMGCWGLGAAVSRETGLKNLSPHLFQDSVLVKGPWEFIY